MKNPYNAMFFEKEKIVLDKYLYLLKTRKRVGFLFS